MRHMIETAPRDGEFVIIEDDVSGTCDVAWLSESGKWVGKNGEPSKITPTHWLPVSPSEDPLQDDGQSSTPADVKPTTWRRCYNLAVDVFAAVALIGLLFYVTRNASHADLVPFNTIGTPVVEQKTQLPGPQQAALAPEPKQSLRDGRPGALVQEFIVSRPAISWLDLQLRAEAIKSAQSPGWDRQKTASPAIEAAIVQQELTTSTAQHRQALDEERTRDAALWIELATAQRELEMQLRKAGDATLQLQQAEAAKNEQLLEQERNRTAALAEEAAAARQELIASTAQHRNALDEERARGATLTSELAIARRELDIQVAQLRKASDEADQLRQAETVNTQSLEREREKTAGLAREAAAARQEMIANSAQHRQSLDEERARRAALWSELAAAQRELETLAAQSRKADDETVPLRQAEAAKREQAIEQERQKTAALAKEAAAVREELTTSAAQHRKALDDERAHNATLTSELASARRDLEMQAAQPRKVSDEAEQLAVAAENAQSLEQEWQKTAALAQEAAASRQELAPNAARVQAEKRKINAWTVGLVGGLLEGAPLRLAAEMSRVVDDGPNLQVLPIVTRGATENLNSLLYLRGVDAAIINSDALDEYRIQLPEIRRRITYLLNLFPSELHIFVRPEIESLQDLAGKKVNFNTQGTAAAYSGPLIFSRLGINAEKTFIPHQVALEQMRKGEMAAVVFITSKPVDAFVKGRWEPGFKFLPVNYERKFEDYYLPAVLEAAEYPGLIKQGERVPTIAVPTALVAFNWPPQSNRYQRVARFVDVLFTRIDKLQAPGFDPKWKSINLAATVPGLDRFAAAQQWLDRQARAAQALR